MNFWRCFAAAHGTRRARAAAGLLAHERMAGSHSELLNLLREEILAVITKHIKVDSDKVNIKLDRGEDVSTLEIDVEMPAAITVGASPARRRVTIGADLPVRTWATFRQHDRGGAISDERHCFASAAMTEVVREHQAEGKHPWIRHSCRR